MEQTRDVFMGSVMPPRVVEPGILLSPKFRKKPEKKSKRKYSEMKNPEKMNKKYRIENEE